MSLGCPVLWVSQPSAVGGSLCGSVISFRRRRWTWSYGDHQDGGSIGLATHNNGAPSRAEPRRIESARSWRDSLAQGYAGDSSVKSGVEWSGVEWSGVDAAVE